MDRVIAFYESQGYSQIEKDKLPIPKLTDDFYLLQKGVMFAIVTTRGDHFYWKSPEENQKAMELWRYRI